MTLDQSQTLETAALTFLFRELETRGIDYAVLRNFEALPHSVRSRDVDILIRPADLARAVGVVADLAADLGCQLSNFYRDDMLATLWLFRRLGEGAFFNFSVDFFPGRQVYGVEFLPTDALLAGAVDHNGIRVVDAASLFLDKWLYLQLIGRPLPERYDDAFSRIAEDHRDDLVTRLTPVMGAGPAAERIDAARRGPPSRVEPPSRSERWKMLARLARRAGPATLARVARFGWYRLRDRLRPPGTFLSISGPDGSGKTTVIDRVIAALEQVNGKGSVTYRHFRPSLLPRIAEVAQAARAVDKVDTDYHKPHRARPSGVAGSLVRLVYYGLDYLGGYLRSIHPVLARRRVVLFDRYIYDMICDPGRSRIALPEWTIRTAARLVPLPRWAFFIRVSPEEVHRRKQELTLERIRDLNARYGALAARGLLIAVDNDGAPQAAADAIVDRIVADRDTEARRAVERLVR